MCEQVGMRVRTSMCVRIIVCDFLCVYVCVCTCKRVYICIYGYVYMRARMHCVHVCRLIFVIRCRVHWGSEQHQLTISPRQTRDFHLSRHFSTPHTMLILSILHPLYTVHSLFFITYPANHYLYTLYPPTCPCLSINLVRVSLCKSTLDFVRTYVCVCVYVCVHIYVRQHLFACVPVYALYLPNHCLQYLSITSSPNHYLFTTYSLPIHRPFITFPLHIHRMCRLFMTYSLPTRCVC
jgi:hypothetical protein